MIKVSSPSRYEELQLLHSSDFGIEADMLKGEPTIWFVCVTCWLCFITMTFSLGALFAIVVSFA